MPDVTPRDARRPFTREDDQAGRFLAGQADPGAESGASLERLAQLGARLLHAAGALVVLTADTQRVVAAAGTLADRVGSEEPLDGSLVPPGTAVLSVDLVSRDQPVGVLLVSDDAGRTWRPEDRSLLEALAPSVVADLELAALESERDRDRWLYGIAVDAAGVGVFDWDLVTDELRWDERLLEVFGIRREQWGGTIEAFNALVHPDDRAHVTAALEQAISTCGVYAAEYRIVPPSGGERWIGARGRALAGPDGTAARVVGAAYDTTAEDDAEARVRRVLEAMPTAFFHLDRDWRFTYLNSEARRLLGAVGTDLEGGVVWDLFPDALDSPFETHYRAAVATGEPVMFEAYYPPPLEAWFEVRAWPTPDGLSVYFLDVTARRAAEQLADAARSRSELLSHFTDTLSGSLDRDEALEQLARLLVGSLGDWVVVTVADHPTDAPAPGGGPRDWKRGLRDATTWHADPAQRELVRQYAEVRLDNLRETSFVARALRERRPVVVAEDATEAIVGVLQEGEAQRLCRLLAPASLACVPLRARGRTLGVVTVFRGSERPAFDGAEVAVLLEAAGRAALALDNARLYAEQRELAEALQRSLMTEPPQPDHLHVAVRYEPAAETAQVGGDWYDAFLQPTGETVVAIGDVVGHDTAAAAAMGQIRGLFRGIAVTTGEGMAEVVRRVDAAMATLRVETTATALVARLEQSPEEREEGLTRVVWSNAGHPPPLVAYPARPEHPARVEAWWPDDPELLLGLEPDSPRTEHVRTLPRGATLLLYTDGLVERRGQRLDEGVAELADVLSELARLELGTEELLDALLERMVPAHAEDDVALLAVRLLPQDRPRPASAGPELVPTPVR